MKATIDVYKVEAVGQVELETEKVQAAKDKALAMARGHSISMSKPKDEFVAVVVKVSGPIKGK